MDVLDLKDSGRISYIPMSLLNEFSHYSLIKAYDCKANSWTILDVEKELPSALAYPEFINQKERSFIKDLAELMSKYDELYSEKIIPYVKQFIEVYTEEGSGEISPRFKKNIIAYILYSLLRNPLSINIFIKILTKLLELTVLSSADIKNIIHKLEVNNLIKNISVWSENQYYAILKILYEFISYDSIHRCILEKLANDIKDYYSIEIFAYDNPDIMLGDNLVIVSSNNFEKFYFPVMDNVMIEFKSEDNKNLGIKNDIVYVVDNDTGILRYPMLKIFCNAIHYVFTNYECTYTSEFIDIRNVLGA